LGRKPHFLLKRKNIKEKKGFPKNNLIIKLQKNAKI